MEQWKGFKKGEWQDKICVADFIQLNYAPYEKGANFLAPATEATQKLWKKVSVLKEKEKAKGILAVETKKPTGITAYGPGYIDKSLEKIVGLQTDKPLKRAIFPFGGIRMVEKSLEEYGYKLDLKTTEVFDKWRKTHNQGVFDAYTAEMLAARKSGVITGLPDAYGRGRIIGDYRRLALYGTARLIEDKKNDLKKHSGKMDFRTITLRENVNEGIRALKELEVMAQGYGFDVTRPASNAQEAIQWTYLAYLAAIKQQDGAAMSLGRVSTFLDIYIERDLKAKLITEEEAQEFVDHFIMKLRMVRFLRTQDYNKLFSGDPVWVTECIGGMGMDGRTLVTRTSYRFLHTLYNLGPAPEPNITVLWSTQLPAEFKKYCAKASIDTCSVQYENDDLMRDYWGDDYAIACCVSAMKLGKQKQFFGARANLGKALLYAINGGKDEVTGAQVGPATLKPITGDVLKYDEVMKRFEETMEWLAGLYMNTLNVIHFMHDKYNFESLQMAFHDAEILRTQATGIAGLSVVVDSLSAIKHAKVKVIRNKDGLATDYQVEGDYPAFGNNDKDVNKMAVNIVEKFMKELEKHETYREAVPTMSILTITSNIIYGEKTGCTPCGRKKGEPFAPGANPMHGRDRKGALASFASVSCLPYDCAQDGISYTFSITPSALGGTEAQQINNLVSMLDGYMGDDGHHVNINVFDRETLIDAMKRPELYPQLTIRVSGYAVEFTKLTYSQQMEVISRTLHEKM